MEPGRLQRVHERFHKHREVATRIARAVRRRMAGAGGVDDRELQSFADEGLYDAARLFHGPEEEFLRYASVRIRGAVKDGLRAIGKLPRKWYRQIAAGEREPVTFAGLEAVDQQLSAAHGDPQAEIVEAIVLRDGIVALNAALPRLGPRDRDIIERILRGDGVTTVGRYLGVSEPRAVQLRQQAIAHVRRLLSDPSARFCLKCGRTVRPEWSGCLRCDRDPRRRSKLPHVALTPEQQVAARAMRDMGHMTMRSIARVLRVSIPSIEEALGQ